MAISKIVGAVFKIPLTNILGGVGMGYYSTAYSLYTPVFAMTAAAIPTVIIKTVADNIALGRFANANKVLRTANDIRFYWGAWKRVHTFSCKAVFGLCRSVAAKRMGHCNYSSICMSLLHLVGL